MKKLFSVSTGILMLSFFLMSATSSIAKQDKFYDKVSSEVATASPDDWMTYAKSAQKLIRKQNHLSDAKEWLQKSLAIKETAFNLEVMGDYYLANNLPKEAVEYYMKSMKSAQDEDFNADVSEVQDKMFRAKQNS